jgi:hydroxymethylbilane synthase
LAYIEKNRIHFKGNITSPNGKQSVDIASVVPVDKSEGLGEKEALRILEKGGKEIAEKIRHE